MTALIRACAPSPPLCLFILALSPPGSWNQLPHSPSQSNTCHWHLRRPYCRQKRHALLSAHVWPLSHLLLLDFDLLETFFRKPSSRVLFFGRLQYRSCSDDFNTVWPSGDFRHNLQIFLCRFICVTSLQSSTDIVCYGSVLFYVSVQYLFLCGICFCMYLFDNLSSSLGSISSALAWPVSRGRHRKLLDNFSHESDVTSPQDPFLTRP